MAMTSETRAIIKNAERNLASRRSKHPSIVALFLIGVACLFLFGWNEPTAMAQANPLEVIGVLPFSAEIPVEEGHIKPANGDLHIQIPLGTFPQRGGPSFLAWLEYDSSIYRQLQTSWGLACCSGNYLGQTSNLGGWRLVTSSTTGLVTYSVTYTGYCIQGSSRYTAYETFGKYAYEDPDGTVRHFPTTSEQGWKTPCYDYSKDPNYNKPITSVVASDASGYRITSKGVFAPDGTFVGSQYVATNHYDTNGNYQRNYFGGSTSIIDTLGRTPILTTISGNTVYLDVLNSTGGTSRYTVTLETVNGYTNFHAAGSPYTDWQGSFKAIQSIQLPDGTSYSFGYDSSTSQGHYGDLTSMTLPTGSTINYSYQNFVWGNYGSPNYYKEVTREIATRTTPDGEWTYTPAVITWCDYSTTYPTCQQQVTETSPAPSSNTTVYKFNINNGTWPIEVDHYTGTSPLLSTQIQSFDYSHTGGTGLPPQYVTQLSETTTLLIPGAASVNQTTQFCYDINYGDQPEFLYHGE
jgi:hypothetical protein